MTESHAEHLLGLASAVLRDYINSTDGDEIGASRDILRLSRLSRTRGLPTFTVDLPAAGKHFDLCLCSGTYTPSHLPGQETVNGGVIPRLFKEILLRVFNLSGSLLDAPDPTAIATLRQLYYAGKKLQLSCSDEKVFEAVATFAGINADLPAPRMDWDADELQLLGPGELHAREYQDADSKTVFSEIEGADWARWRPDSRLLSLCQSVFDTLAITLGEFDPDAWPHKHGPGRVSDLPGWGFKYDLPGWHNRLDGIFKSDWHRCVNACHQLELPLDVLEDTVERGSKLIAVPKTLKAPRLIAAEPVAHQWCQQAIWSYLESMVTRSWISGFVNFRNQTRNQDLARFGSQSGRLATVDLSAASDRVSLRFVESLFRSNATLLVALHSCRTRWVEQNLDKKTPPCIKLRMFSTMGSACTFPVETIGFLGIALAALVYKKTSDRQRVTPEYLSTLRGQCHVFGDDVVISRDAIVPFYQLLNYFDHKVNLAKSFWTGRFRESCGVDAYGGYDVTPAYVMRLVDSRKPETVVSVTETSNNFFKKGYWHAATFIAENVKHLVPIVHADSGSFGLKSFCRSADYVTTLKKRWNDSLHRMEAFIPAVTTRVKKVRAEGWGALLQYFTERPAPDLKWQAGVTLPSAIRLKRRWVPIQDLGFDT